MDERVRSSARRTLWSTRARGFPGGPRRSDSRSRCSEIRSGRKLTRATLDIMMPVVDGATSSSRHEQLPVETDSLGNVRRTVTDPAGNTSPTVEASWSAAGGSSSPTR